jgi:hypothetical protein
VDLDFVAGFQFRGLDHGGGKADGEAIAPFGDLHGTANHVSNPKGDRQHFSLTKMSGLKAHARFNRR